MTEHRAVTSLTTASAARRLPSVTAVVCAYNYERYIAEALDSALAQEYPAELLDIVVIDDGSTDRTPEILARYAAEHGDRIRVITQENAGLVASTERGIAEATGELIALLDADDAWLPQKTRRQVEVMMARPEVGLVYCDAEVVDGVGRTIASSWWRQIGRPPLRGWTLGPFLRQNIATAPTVMFRGEFKERVLPISRAFYCQDWWLVARIGDVAQLDYSREPLVRYRRHDSNMSSQYVKNLRADVVLQRWMLRHLELDRVSRQEIRAAWHGLRDGARKAQQWSGRPYADEVPVTAEDRDAWRGHMVAAGAAAARGELHAAARQYAAALACDPYDLAAQRGLDAVVDAGVVPLHRGPDAAVLAAARDLDPDRAAHVLRRTLADAPERTDVLLELARTEARRGRWEQAVAAWQAAGPDALMPRDSVQLEQAQRRVAATGALEVSGPDAAGDRGRLLLCADALPPASDGSERLVEGMAVALRDAGWDVELVTRADLRRSELVHLGMPLHELRRDPAQELREIVERRAPKVVLAVSLPQGWPVASALKLPPGGPRVVVAPALDLTGDAELRASAVTLAAYRNLLERADGVVRLTRSGVDARLLAELGVDATHVPMGWAPVAPASPLEALDALLPDGPPLLLTTGELTSGRGIGELLRALAHHSGDWRLAVAGAPRADHPDVAVELERLARADRRITLLPTAGPAEVAALLGRASVLLAPSPADPFATGLLDAMCHGVPWIARTGSTGAGELAGGAVLGVEELGAGLDVLLGDRRTAERLGAAGREHWHAWHAWPVVTPRLDAVLRGVPVATEIEVPANAAAITDEVRAAIFDRADQQAPERTYEPLIMEVPA
jgi:glycosyltransferase involved in cell wall biosynthesis